jgi:hypothetical protein
MADPKSTGIAQRSTKSFYTEPENALPDTLRTCGNTVASRIRRSAGAIVAPLSCVSLLTLTMLGIIGCSAVRYEVVKPEFASIEPGNKPTALGTRDGIAYEVRQVENKLVLRFLNTGASPADLLAQSAILDAKDASYPVEAMRVAPLSSGRVVIPPRVEQTSRWNPAPSEAGSPTDDGVFSVGRVPLEAYQREPVRTFDWPMGESVTAELRWLIDGKPITHTFVLRRAGT